VNSGINLERREVLGRAPEAERAGEVDQHEAPVLRNQQVRLIAIDVGRQLGEQA
jgi:hypothetical protein